MHGVVHDTLAFIEGRLILTHTRTLTHTHTLTQGLFPINAYSHTLTRLYIRNDRPIGILTTEVNSATDNPMVFANTRSVISGGERGEREKVCVRVKEGREVSRDHTLVHWRW